MKEERKQPTESSSFADIEKNAGAIIRDFLRGATYTTGSPGGGTVYGGMASGTGDVGALIRAPDSHTAHLSVDLPFYIPIDDGAYTVTVDSGEYCVIHRTKQRGEEEFSTLPSDRLLRFSHLDIQGVQVFPILEEAESKRNFGVICAILAKLENYLELGIETCPVLSFRAQYFEKDQGRLVAETVYPFSGDVIVDSPEYHEVDSGELKRYLAHRVLLSDYAKRTIAPQTSDFSFARRVFLIIHDFCFYCRQHSEALTTLFEEHIRDLLLLVFKACFSSAEGECYHFDGKTDFKVTNPDNRYEFVTGELKWWRGTDSATTLFHQAVRKHATGQESAIYAIVLNRNADAEAVFDSTKGIFASQDECAERIETYHEMPRGSKERYCEFDAIVRGSPIPLCLFINDVFHARA